MAIKGVTFDWWGTVVKIPAVRDIYDETMREIRVDRVAKGLEEAGVRVNRTLLWSAYDAQTDLLLRTWNDLQDLSVEEQTRAYLGLLGVGEGREDLVRTLQEAFGSAIEARPPAPIRTSGGRCAPSETEDTARVSSRTPAGPGAVSFVRSKTAWGSADPLTSGFSPTRSASGNRIGPFSRRLSTKIGRAHV